MINWTGVYFWSTIIGLVAAYLLLDYWWERRWVKKYKIDGSAMCKVMTAMLVSGFSSGCAPTPPKPIIQFKTVEVPVFIRAPIPTEYTVDRTVAEPAPACGKLYCNGQVANLIDDYRAALRQSNLDKAALRSLQPTPETK